MNTAIVKQMGIPVMPVVGIYSCIEVLHRAHAKLIAHHQERTDPANDDSQIQGFGCSDGITPPR